MPGVLLPRSVPLGEAPTRIAYQEETNSFGVLSKRLEIMDKGGFRPARDSVSTQVSSPPLHFYSHYDKITKSVHKQDRYQYHLKRTFFTKEGQRWEYE
jgi:hypothetical protein